MVTPRGGNLHWSPLPPLLFRKKKKKKLLIKLILKWI
jgi:hypothetical protein